MFVFVRRHSNIYVDFTFFECIYIVHNHTHAHQHTHTCTHTHKPTHRRTHRHKHCCVHIKRQRKTWRICIVTCEKTEYKKKRKTLDSALDYLYVNSGNIIFLQASWLYICDFHTKRTHIFVIIRL